MAIDYITKIRKVTESLEFPDNMSDELKFYGKFKIEGELRKLIKKIEQDIRNEPYRRLNVANETIKELNNRIAFLNGRIEGLEQYIKGDK